VGCRKKNVRVQEKTAIKNKLFCLNEIIFQDEFDVRIFGLYFIN